MKLLQAIEIEKSKIMSNLEPENTRKSCSAKFST